MRLELEGELLDDDGEFSQIRADINTAGLRNGRGVRTGILCDSAMDRVAAELFCSEMAWI